MTGNGLGPPRRARSAWGANLCAIGIVAVVVLAWLAWSVANSPVMDRCKPAGWVEASTAEMLRVVPPGAVDVEPITYADDCAVPNVASVLFVPVGSAGEAESGIVAAAIGNGWAAPSPGECLRKQIVGEPTELWLMSGWDGKGPRPEPPEDDDRVWELLAEIHYPEADYSMQSGCVRSL